MRRISTWHTGPPAGVLAVAVLLAAATVPAAARANPFDVYGIGSRATALAGAGATTADDYSAAYYNLAAMVLGPSSVGGGSFVSMGNLGIELSERPPGYDLPDLGTSSPAIGYDLRLRDRADPEAPEPFVSAFLGATTDIGVDDLRVGFAALMPLHLSTETQTTFADEREQYFTNTLHWDLLGARIEHSTVLFGAAYRIHDWVAAGVGASFLPSARLDNAIYVDNPTDQSDIDLNVSLAVPAHFAANFGILLIPRDNIRFGAAFRDRQRLRLFGQNEVQVRGLHTGEEFPVLQDIDVVLWYTPRQFVWGASWSLSRVLLTGDVTYALWSDYVGSHNDPAYGFRDTFVPRLGVEYTAGSRTAIRAGVLFEPSPVPEQTGRTSYVDNDRLVLSLGGGRGWSVAGSTLSLDAHLQVHALLPRDHLKSLVADPASCSTDTRAICDELPDTALDVFSGEPFPEARGLQTGNPGFPGYASGGWLASVGLEVSWSF